MSLEKQLEELQRQRRAEIRNLHSTYLRTKREVQRTVSPTRIVRRHLGVSLAAAAALGMFLAPRPGPKAPAAGSSKGTSGKKGGVISLRWAKKMLRKVSPQLADYLPDSHEEHSKAKASDSGHKEPEHHEQAEKEHEERNKGAFRRLIEALLPLMLNKVNWRKVVEQMAEGMARRMHHRSNGHSPGSPRVSVADAGTIHPHDYEDFE